jgi:hypothetical protein
MWGDKLAVLGAIHLTSEALVRSKMMDSEEFVDRVAWVCLERIVREGERGSHHQHHPHHHHHHPHSQHQHDTSVVSPLAARIASLQNVKRILGELRSTHASFHSTSDHPLVHGAILILLRVCHVALISSELAASPYGWTLDRLIQDVVFLCDFADMILAEIALSPGNHHQPLREERPDHPSLWLPAHYANEALLRCLPCLDLQRLALLLHDRTDRHPSSSSSSAAATTLPASLTHASCRSCHKMLTLQAQGISNRWLRTNVERLASGYKAAAQCGETLEARAKDMGFVAAAAAAGSESTTTATPTTPPELTPTFFLRAAVDEIMRERASGISAWAARHGTEVAAPFMDPLYRIDDEIAV